MLAMWINSEVVIVGVHCVVVGGVVGGGVGRGRPNMEPAGVPGTSCGHPERVAWVELVGLGCMERVYKVGACSGAITAM